MGQTLYICCCIVKITDLHKARFLDPDPYPDPDWIRIQSGQWIRIRNPDPDPEGQK
jgi:hypothetical protein